MTAPLYAIGRGTDSTKATELLEDNLPEQAHGSSPLALEAPAGKLTQRSTPAPSRPRSR